MGTISWTIAPHHRGTCFHISGNSLMGNDLPPSLSTLLTHSIIFPRLLPIFIVEPSFPPVQRALFELPMLQLALELSRLASCCARLSTTLLRPKSTCTRWLIPLFWNLQMLATALLGRPAGFLPRTHNSTRCRIEYRQGVNMRQTKHTQRHSGNAGNNPKGVYELQ